LLILERDQPSMAGSRNHVSFHGGSDCLCCGGNQDINLGRRGTAGRRIRGVSISRAPDNRGRVVVIEKPAKSEVIPVELKERVFEFDKALFHREKAPSRMKALTSLIVLILTKVDFIGKAGVMEVPHWRNRLSW